MAALSVSPERWLIILNEYADVTHHTGGVGRRYAALVPSLATLGIEVTVLLFAETDVDPPTHTPGIHFEIEKRTRRIPRPARLLLRPLLARRLASKLRPDVVVAPEWQGLAAFLPAKSKLITNMVTGMRLINELTPVRRSLFSLRAVTDWVQIRLEELQVRRSRGVISVSTAIDRILHAEARSPVASQVVRNCIDVSRVRELAGQGQLPKDWPANVDPAAPVFLFAGRLESRKGAPVAAAAFERVVRHVPDAYFLFAGGDGDTSKELGRSELRALMPSVPSQRIRFFGDLRGELLYGAMANATTILCPSRWEAFGNIALEAKASGRPVIVTSGSGFDDFCNDDIDAYTCKADDPDSLAAACLRSVTAPERAAEIAHEASLQVESFEAPSVAVDFLAAARRLAAD